MNLYGCCDESSEVLTLKEVTVQASSEEIRKLAKFFLQCADEIDNDDRWEHEHLSDFEELYSGGAEIIVFRKDG